GRMRRLVFVVALAGCGSGSSATGEIKDPGVASATSSSVASSSASSSVSASSSEASSAVSSSASGMGGASASSTQASSASAGGGTAIIDCAASTLQKDIQNCEALGATLKNSFYCEPEDPQSWLPWPDCKMYSPGIYCCSE